VAKLTPLLHTTAGNRKSTKVENGDFGRNGDAPKIDATVNPLVKIFSA
jgi:hypothetical protein